MCHFMTDNLEWGDEQNRCPCSSPLKSPLLDVVPDDQLRAGLLDPLEASVGERISLTIRHAIALCTSFRVVVDLPMGNLDRDGRAQRTKDELNRRLVRPERLRLRADVQHGEDRTVSIVWIGAVAPIEHHRGRNHSPSAGVSSLGDDLREPARGRDEGEAGGE